MKKMFTVYLCAVALIIVIGCTATEWGRVKDDAVKDFPVMMDDLGKSGGNPISIAYILAAYAGGLVSKSAARGFGKAGKKGTDITKAVLKGLSEKLAAKKDEALEEKPE
jgi:hypothetical protein